MGIRQIKPPCLLNTVQSAPIPLELKDYLGVFKTLCGPGPVMSPSPSPGMLPLAPCTPTALPPILFLKAKFIPTWGPSHQPFTLSRRLPQLVCALPQKIIYREESEVQKSQVISQVYTVRKRQAWDFTLGLCDPPTPGLFLLGQWVRRMRLWSWDPEKGKRGGGFLHLLLPQTLPPIAFGPCPGLGAGDSGESDQTLPSGSPHLWTKG